MQHVVIDQPSSSLACCHCGTVETLPQPIPEHALQAWLQSFESIHVQCVRPDELPPLLLPRALPIGFNASAAPKGLEDWLRKGDRGASSETIVSFLTGLEILPMLEWIHPTVPADLNRCENLLHSVPSLRPRLTEMSRLSVAWAYLIPEWDALVAMMQVELRMATGLCPRTACRMISLSSELLL